MQVLKIQRHTVRQSGNKASGEGRRDTAVFAGYKF